MSRFEPDHRGIRDALREVDALADDRLEAIGRLSVRVARGKTPVRTGAMRDAISYEVDRAEKAVAFGVLPGPIARRPETAADPRFYARFVELGTATQPPQAPLRKTLDELTRDYLRIAGRGR